MGNDVHMLAVQRACEIANGVGPLALFLGIPAGLVEAWIAGKQDVPPAVFLRIVSIILDREAQTQGAIPVFLAESLKYREAANR